MESVFTNPKGLSEELKKVITEAEEKGEVGEEEMVTLIQEAEKGPPSKALKTGEGEKKGKEKMVFRGEGGSGEPRVKEIKKEKAMELQPGFQYKEPGGGGRGEKKEKKVAGAQDAKEGMEEGEGGGEEEGSLLEEEGGDWEQAEEAAGGDAEAHTEDVASSAFTTPSQMRKREETELGELRAYCEEQFASLVSMIQPLLARVESLERASASRVPLNPGMLSPPRHLHKRVGSGGGGGAGGGRGGAGTPGRKEVPREKVASFIRTYPSFPTLAVTRRAKVRQLQEAMGLDPKEIEVRASEWTEEGLYTLMVVAHDAE